MNEIDLSKQFAVRLIEEMINDYIRNVRVVKTSRSKTEVCIAKRENAEFKEYLLLDSNRPLLDLIDSFLGIGVNRFTKQFLKFLERIDEESNMIEHSQISSRRIVRSQQMFIFEEEY